MPVANVYQPARALALAPVIDQYLSRYNSPLTGLGNVFARKAKDAGIDPRLLVAIAGAESSFGKNMPEGYHNAWGWGPHIKFPSWGKAIGTISQGLADNYFGQGLTTIPEIGAKYAPIGAGNDPTNLNSNWSRSVTKFYNELKKMKPPGGRLFPVLGGFKWNDLGGPDPHTAKAQNRIWQNMNAVDLGAPVGTPVYAPFGGRLTGGFGENNVSGQVYGSRLSLYSPRINNTLFMTHMSRLAPGLRPEARVRRGDLLGYIGPMPGGPSHLHVASQYGNPYDLLRGGRARFYSGGTTGYDLAGPAGPSQARAYSVAQQQASNAGGAMLAGATSGSPSDSPQGRKRRKKADDKVAQLIATLAQAAAGANAMKKKRRLS